MIIPAICGEFGEVRETTRKEYVDPPIPRQVDAAVSGRIGLLSSLAYSKNLGLLYKSFAIQDIPNTFVVSYLYELPFGINKTQFAKR